MLSALQVFAPAMYEAWTFGQVHTLLHEGRQSKSGNLHSAYVLCVP